MRYLLCMTTTTLALVACGAQQTSEPTANASSTSGAEHAPTGEGSAEQPSPEQSSEFVLHKSEPAGAAGETRPATASKIKPTATEAALKLVVIDKDKGPIPGIIIALTAPDGAKLYSEETNAEGYTELLVPVGQKYELVYLSLGRKDIAASLPVSGEPRQNIKLTLRYKRYTPPPRPSAPASPAEPAPAPGFILDAVTFDSGKATVRDESFAQLDGVAEYLTHKKSARIEISGHTDNVGNAKVNKALSLKRAQACRDYLISKGVEAGRIEATGYGDERPIASNDNDEGRQQNRRIEASEL